MAPIKSQSPVVDELRPVLEGIAKNLADRIWGAPGPAWGTKRSELEHLVVALREVISEKRLREACQRQAAPETERPAEYRDCPGCGRPTQPRDPEPRIVPTLGGDAEWPEPREHGTRCRRAFFPSVQKLGD